MSEEAIAASIRQTELEQSLEAKRLSNLIAVPTNDQDVCDRLRYYNQPACFFGENMGDRRNRLKHLLADRKARGESIDEMPTPPKLKPATEPKKTILPLNDHKQIFYSEGSPALRRIRFDILRHSLSVAQKRIEKEKRKKSKESKEEKRLVFEAIKRFCSRKSEVGDSRALSCVAVSGNGASLASGSWSGNIKIWPLSNDSLEPVVLRSGARVSDCKFFNDSSHLASCGFDGVLSIWDMKNNTKAATLKLHGKRLTKMAFLPMDKHLAVVGSFDKSWSLSDLKAQRIVFRQQGHSSEPYALAVHPDSSLILSGDLSGIGRVWDLRSGQVVLNLRDHVRQILSAAFSPNGYQAATGSGDHSIKVWDLRAKNLFYSIAAHFRDVSALEFNKESTVLVSGSFDNTIRIWSGKTFRLQKTLIGHEDKVMDLALSKDLERVGIFSVSFDRTLKNWGI